MIKVIIFKKKFNSPNLLNIINTLILNLLSYYILDFLEKDTKNFEMYNSYHF